jgi:hypothetical protein
VPTQPRTTTQAAATAPQTTAPPAQAQPAATAPAQPAPKPAATPIDETARVTLVSRSGPGRYSQHGTVTGTYDGVMSLDAKITDRGVEVQFTAALPGGTVAGTGLAVPEIGNSPLAKLHGTAAITGGTGRFAHARGHDLQVSGRAALDGSRATVRMVGSVVL